MSEMKNILDGEIRDGRHHMQVRATRPVHLCTRSKTCYTVTMSSAVEKAVEALELLPEEMQDSAASYLLSQARKFRALKDAIDEGMADVEAGRVIPWDLEEFLKQARTKAQG